MLRDLVAVRRTALAGLWGLLALGAAGCVVETHPYHERVVVEERPRERVIVEERPRERVVVQERGTTTIYEEDVGETTVVTEVAPPPPRVEVVYETRPGYYWIKGYWAWRGRWVWCGGHWHACPRGRTLYVSGHWERRGNSHVWISGYWR
jgi:hypothetical protein